MFIYVFSVALDETTGIQSLDATIQTVREKIRAVKILLMVLSFTYQFNFDITLTYRLACQM